MNIKPIKDRLLLHPSDSSMRGSLFIPDRYKDASTSCKVIEVGPDVSPFIKKDDIVLCQVGFGDRKNNTVDNTRTFWCREHNIYAVIKNKEIYPIGRKVLIKRDIADKYVGEIVIPENRRYQSLDGEIVKLGLSRRHFKIKGLRPGMKIRLTEWSEHMIDMTLSDGSYGLIVNESDILFSYEH